MRSPGLSRSTGDDFPCESWQNPPLTPRITWSRLATPIQNAVTLRLRSIAYHQRLEPGDHRVGQRPRLAGRAIDHHHRGIRGRGAFPFMEHRLQERVGRAPDPGGAGPDLDRP